MKIEVRVPSVGESVSTADIESWEKKTGDFVKKGELLVTLETDKASMEVPVEQEGRLEILKQKGDTVSVNEVIALIDTSAQIDSSRKTQESSKTDTLAQIDSSRKTQESSKTDTLVQIDSSRKAKEPLKEENNKTTAKQEVFESLPDKKKLSDANESSNSHSVDSNRSNYKSLKFEKSLEDFSPAVRHLLAGKSLSLSQIQGTGRGGRLIKEDILRALESSLSEQEQAGAADCIESPHSALESSSSAQEPSPELLRREEFSSSKLSQKAAFLSEFREETSSASKKDSRQKESKPAPPALKEGQRRESMTRLRRVTAERLVQSQHNTATLSTFNEADMSRIIEIRKDYQQEFIKKYGFKLGFMSFFVKAVVSALKKHPKINAFIEGEDIIYNDHQHIGIAVSTEKGLVVPILFYAEALSLAQIEKKIIEYRDKALARKLRPDDLLGGTFTISNGGVFGSLLSTPILNPPQSGILGMHRIEQRPVVINGKIEIRPMMYLALSYDHRMVDGKESVGFLVKVKEGLEEPSRLLIDV